MSHLVTVTPPTSKVFQVRRDNFALNHNINVTYTGNLKQELRNSDSCVRHTAFALDWKMKDLNAPKEAYY